MLRRQMAAVAAVLSLCAVPAQAQLALSVSGGATVPLGDFDEYSSTGWMGTLGLMTDIGGKGLGFGGHLYYGENPWAELDDAKSKLSGALATARWRFGDAAKANVFVVGNLGYMSHTISTPRATCANPCPIELVDSGDGGMAYGAGAGIELPRGRMKWYLLARYLAADINDATTALAPLTIGVSFPLRK
jgi:hypothetical protein